ncbi:hypothetical protein E2542_SST01972 [Spatholobus suberectus]|nr:hypothetical protein E2542_SST01972 [Spatholobus suberectus]
MMAKSSIIIVLQLLMFLCCSVAYNNFVDESSIVYTYSRVAEIEKHCTPYLTSSSKSISDDNRGYTLQRELSFTNGDWKQEYGGFPLMPLDESDLQWHRLPHRVDPLQLVSFQVQDINIVHHFDNASVNVGGILSIGISRKTTFFPSLRSPSFAMMPGFSLLTVVFEGLYFESEESGGDRLLCLLGNAALPMSEPHVEYWDITNSHWSGYSHQPRLLRDDQILLVLRYPQTFNLTSRAIEGEIRSLNKHGSLEYFDDVHISSQLNRHSKYQFSPELMPRSCDDKHFCQEDRAECDALTFSGSEFCKTFQSISEPFNVIPNYKFTDRYAYQSKLGLLQPGKEFDFANWRLNHEDFWLVLQHVICGEETNNHNIKNARISATLRVFPASIPADTARDRTGLSNLTFLAEGTWDSSSGQLCMIGCSGEVDSVLENCNYQISLYFPRVYSIKQRSLILGSISSMANETNMFFPLLINYGPCPVFLHLSLGPCSSSYLSYNYSMIQLATSIRRRNQPSKFRLLRQPSFLKYLALEDEQDVLAQLSFLSKNLSFDAYAICKHCLDKHNSRVFIHMDVFSLGPLFGPYVPWLCKNDGAKKPAGTEKLTNTQILNISLHLIFNEGPSVFTIKQYRHLSPLFLEGVYDPLAGQMYLIGCRMVSNVSTNIGYGLDCLVDVKVQYPSLSGRWLKNPSVEITITSQRHENDPLHFNAIPLQTDIIPYLKHQDDVAFRKLFESVLRLLISCALVGIIFSQLSYMNRNLTSIPHISLVMVAEQILGYGAELFRDTEILLESKESAAYRDLSHYAHGYKHILNPLEIITRLVVLVALLLTIRLYKKVSGAKKRSRACWSNKEKCLPQSKNVLLWNLKVHIVVCLVLTGLLAIELSLRNNLRSLGLIDVLFCLGS